MTPTARATRSLIAIAVTLTALLVATTAGSAARGAKPPTAAAPDVPAKVDADGDRVFDDLEVRLGEMSGGDTVKVLVALSATASAERVADISQRVGGFTTIRRFGIVDGFAATVTKGQAEALTHVPWVEHVELDATVHALNDTAQASFGVTKAVLDDPALDGDADGNPAVYSPADLVAAVIDTGIDPTHRDLDGGKVIAFEDFVNGRTTAYDDEGHGTHVSATIAGDGGARTDRLYHGVAPGGALVGLKVLNSSGSGSFDNVIAALDWVVANKSLYGIEAVNMSLGADGCNNGTDLPTQAVTRVVAAGVVVAVAAGNSGPGTCTVGTPGAAAAALTVGAMSDLGAGGFALASFSSRGKTADGRIKPDIVAPGVAVTSAAANTTTGYATWSGTSMATPFVAGLALLMRDANPLLTPQQVKDAMTSTADDWGPAGADGDYGAGRLDAYAALAAAGAPLTTGPDVPAHLFRNATLAATHATADYVLNVTDLRFPIAATLTVSAQTGPAGTGPDFDLFLYGPSGTKLDSSEGVDRHEDVSFRPTQTGSYTVRVLSYSGTGPFFVDISAGLTPLVVTLPGAPTLTSAAPGNGSVALAWSAPASDGNASITYNVYRGTASGNETLVGNTAALGYTDSGLANGTTYWYQVTAVNSAGEGPRSNELSATPAVPVDSTPPSKPASLKALVVGTTQVALDWPASTDNTGVTGYELYRGDVSIATVTTTQYLDSGLTPGATYAYQVKALDGAGNRSLPSSTLSVGAVALTTSSTGTLGGPVYDATGTPLRNAIVTLTLASGALKSAKTNSSGVWKISNLPPRDYAPSVSLGGYQSQTLGMTAVAGRTVLAATVLAS